MSGWPDRRFLPEYLRKRWTSTVGAAAPGMGGTRHRRGSVTDAQQELHDYVVDHHGGHSTYVANDGSMHLTRPGKLAINGTSASVITGEQGDAILTVFSPHWPEIGPSNGDASVTWRLVDGKLTRAYLDPLQGVTMNAPITANGSQPAAVETVALIPMPLFRFEHTPDPFVVPVVEWHAEALLARPTHGELAGAEKSLKSYTGLCLDVGLAAGLPVLGRFAVPEPQRVSLLTGEGGRGPWLRRFAAVCSAYGITPADIRPNVHMTWETASATSPKFIDSVRAELESFGPALVHLDPWYAYAGGQTDSRQVVEVGASLAAIGELCASHDATLLINHHYNRQGNEGLRAITGAGHAEWVDSWLLVAHRQPADPGAGRYRLRLDVGSRQWGGESYDLDLDISPITGAVSWAVTEASTANDEDDSDPLIEVKLDLLRIGRKARKAMTRAAWISRCKRRISYSRAAFDELVEEEQIIVVATVKSGVNTVSTFEVRPS